MDDKYIDNTELSKVLEAYIDNQVAKRLKNYSVNVFVGDEEFQADIEHSDGQINVRLLAPLFALKSGKVFFVSEAPPEPVEFDMPKRFAIYGGRNEYLRKAINSSVKAQSPKEPKKQVW